MPAPHGESAIIKRLAALLAALSSEYRSRDELISAAGCYPVNAESAGRMLRGDIESLRALGFVIERAEGHHDPEWRLVSHRRLGD